MEYTVEAKNKKIGRIASEVAILLMGKNKTDFQKNMVADVKVKVVNVSKMDIDQKKMTDKTYARFSGYPSGLRMDTMKSVIAKKGEEEIVKRAVHGMLPGNKLRAQMMKNLTITA